jgi:hypothetical protein
MMSHADSTKHIALRVRAMDGTTQKIRVTVAEPHEAGTLVVLTPAGEVDQQFELSRLRKDRDGTQLTCYVSGATVTLLLRGDKKPPELHVSASLFFPVFEAVYHIDAAEQERFMAWINDLRIGLLTTS